MTGYPGTPPLDAIKGDVVSSVSGDPVAKLTTSSDLVNQMWSIGIWGQRGNFLSIHGLSAARRTSRLDGRCRSLLANRKLQLLLPNDTYPSWGYMLSKGWLPNPSSHFWSTTSSKTIGHIGASMIGKREKQEWCAEESR